MKHLIITTLLTLGLGGFLLAQGADETTNIPGRLQLSLQLGHQLGSSDAGAQSGVVHQYYRGAVHYRFSRGFDLGLSLGFNRGRGNGTRDSENVPRLGPQTNYRHLENSYLLGVAPRLNYRLGQGDLSFTIGLGIMHHRHSKILDRPDEESIQVEYVPVTKPYGEIGVGYSYWVSPKLGFMASANYLRLQHDGDYEIGRIIQLGLEEEAAIERAFRDNINNWSQLYLSVGVVIRPFQAR